MQILNEIHNELVPLELQIDLRLKETAWQARDSTYSRITQSNKQLIIIGIEHSLHLPISSIMGAIRSVTPINMRHISNRRQAVAMIVQRARCERSWGSIT